MELRNATHRADKKTASGLLQPRLRGGIRLKTDGPPLRREGPPEKSVSHPAATTRCKQSSAGKDKRCAGRFGNQPADRSTVGSGQRVDCRRRQRIAEVRRQQVEVN